jgi:CheY-like chemotaxis protein
VIILADDDADQRLSLRLALELAGYTVREAADGRRALELQQQQAASFVITDIFMPERDGFELIEAVRRDFPTTKIIAISGGGERAKMDYLHSAKLLGVDATLRKPVNPEELVALLRELGSR